MAVVIVRYHEPQIPAGQITHTVLEIPNIISKKGLKKSKIKKAKDNIKKNSVGYK